MPAASIGSLRRDGWTFCIVEPPETLQPPAIGAELGLDEVCVDSRR